MINDYSKAREAIKNSSKSSSIYIGADSLKFKKGDSFYARYSTVIIVHMDSNKGGKVFHFMKTERDFGNLRQRLLMEVSCAIEAAEAVIDVVEDRHLEIHLDLNANPKHKSNVAVKEALGWVHGTMGIQAKIKPNSFAASHAADHVVRYKPM
jgi:predicted RNase H-related nuclease YkuK (DUF458 family)